MIFDANYTSTSDLSAIKESPYELGLAGAMMHVYENECNYNAIMKAVGISELKYYQETGKDLFVHEAGAFKGFIDKIKAFFKKVIEKIKSIFKKFIAIINQYTMSDKDFVKKYGTELIRKNLKDFEFDGYTFENLPEFFKNVETGSSAISTICETLSDAFGGGHEFIIPSKLLGVPININSDQKDEAKECIRGYICTGNATKRLDDSDLKDYVKEQCYGEKETLDNINMRELLSTISDSSKEIKEVEKLQKNIEKNIEKAIKVFDKLSMDITKYHGTKPKDGLTGDEVDEQIKAVNFISDLAKDASNTITICFGGIVQARKDFNRQAKAICVKALSYKHEAAMVSESSYSDDIFAGVVIR